MPKKARKQFQVIQVPAPGESAGSTNGLNDLKAPKISYTEDSPEKAVETARWGAFNNPGSGRKYRVRDRLRKEIIFELDAAKASQELLCSVLYDGWQFLRPHPLTATLPGDSATLPGEWLHEDFQEPSSCEPLFYEPSQLPA